MEKRTIEPWRDRIAKALMLTLALGASVAFASSSRAVTAALTETKALEIWRMLGDLAFSAIFILLALRPRRQPGLWEISFFHYAGVSAFLVAIAPSGSANGVVIDAVIATVIGACYFLTKGYLAWNVAEPETRGRGYEAHVLG